MSLTKDFYINNRDKLATVLPSSYIVISANSKVQKSADLSYPFQQDNNFWYLTGINEPDYVLAIDTVSGVSTLFTPTLNQYQEDWDGTFDENSIKSASGIREFCDISKITSETQKAEKRGLEICYLKPLDEVVEPYGFYSNPARREIEKKILSVNSNPKDVRIDIARLRQIKQPEEIKLIQKAIDITGKTLSEVRAQLSEFDSEKDVERAITAGFYNHGGDGHAFDPIIAGGKNAATIHYTSNSSKLSSGDLVLLDIGTNYERYPSDISRTWSLGQPTKRQQEIYSAVLDIQDHAFKLLKPGANLRKNQQALDAYAKKILKKIGIDRDKFPHGISHFVGLDVHDAGDYNASLAENMILTVEPGVYLPEENIGIRIEDVVRITRTGIDIMSKDIPKEL